MSARTLLGGLALVVLGLMAWELRQVLLVLFGAVVLAVALDVPITLLRRLLPLSRPAALAAVLLALLLIAWGLSGLLLALPLAVCLQVIAREVLIHDVLDGWRQPRLAP